MNLEINIIYTNEFFFYLFFFYFYLILKNWKEFNFFFHFFRKDFKIHYLVIFYIFFSYSKKNNYAQNISFNFFIFKFFKFLVLFFSKIILHIK